MKDDSLSDVVINQFENEPPNSVGKQEPDNRDTLELRTAMNKDIWNAAIEAAAGIVDGSGNEFTNVVSYEIRRLKK